MVPLKTERRVYLWRVEPRPSPRDATKPVSMSEVLGILAESYKKGQAEIYISSDGRVLDEDADPKDQDPKNRVYIAEMAHDQKQKAMIMLVNRGDPNAADTAFINAKSKKVRPARAQADESQGWSAHLVLATNATGGVHRACFERMPNVPSSYAETLLRTLLERYAERDPKYSYPKRVKRGKQMVVENRRYSPSLAINRVPSEKLVEDLKRGQLKGITLITKKFQYQGPDKPHLVKSVEHRLLLKTREGDTDSVMSFLKELSPWARREGYEEVQVRLSDLPGGMNSSPRFKLEVEDAAETLYVRSQRLLGFKTFLERCYGEICDEIADKMIKLLHDDTRW